MRLVILVLICLVQPNTAWAHAPLPGIEGFYVGLVHPFTMPAELLALLGFSLLAGQHLPLAQKMWKAFALGNVVGLGLAVGAWITFDANLPLLVLTVVVGLYVASALSLPQIGARLGGAAIGFFVGAVSLADPGPLPAMAFTTLGALVGANMLFFFVAAGLLELQGKLKWPWLHIALRVAGSWIAAVSLLLAALTFRAKT